MLIILTLFPLFENRYLDQSPCSISDSSDCLASSCTHDGCYSYNGPPFIKQLELEASTLEGKLNEVGNYDG